MFSHHQQGKGIFSFMAGSIVALGAISAVLFMLNKNNSCDFKQPQLAQEVKQPPRVETLTPNGRVASSEVASLPSANTNVSVAASAPILPASEPVATTKSARSERNERVNMQESSKIDLVENSKKTTSKIPQDVPYDPVLGSVDVIDEVPVKKNNTRSKINTVEKRKQPEKSTQVADEDVQPTAEQILNSGNIEKAREVAKKAVQEKRNKIDVVNEKASSKKRTVQAGAYNNRAAADAQRAKLALQGVQTHVVEANNNGKIVYRVQTEALDGKQAEKVRQNLKNHGIDTFTR